MFLAQAEHLKRSITVRRSLESQGLFHGPGEALGRRPLPSVRTIGRILARHGLGCRRKGRYKPKHGELFHVYRTGTSLQPSDYTDTIMMCQGERHILEFTFDEPGRFMFHAHQSEFTELGWMGVFNVVDAVA